MAFDLVLGLELAGLTALCWVGWTAVHRLYFHPLAMFPGPRLAALTQLYEAWYDFIGHTGQYTFYFEKLHEQYGKQPKLTPRSPDR
jgi:hypothetical protein